MGTLNEGFEIERESGVSTPGGFVRLFYGHYFTQKEELYVHGRPTDTVRAITAEPKWKVDLCNSGRASQIWFLNYKGKK